MNLTAHVSACILSCAAGPADLEAFKDAGVGGVVYYDQVHGSGEKALEAMRAVWRRLKSRSNTDL